MRNDFCFRIIISSYTVSLPYLPNGHQRIKGELYDDESVQKILPDYVKVTFTKYVKYPRTWHLPWSPGATDDDRIIPSTDVFEGRDVVVTIKMDGENTTLYNDYMHARSVTSEVDVTKHWMKNFHASKGYEIPEGWRVSGENLYAKHSIKYESLPSYFLMFSVWNERNVCMPWAQTVEWAALLDFEVVPVLYEGRYDEKLIKGLYRERIDGTDMEGYVIRLAGSFHYMDFKNSVAKYVRKDHVQTSEQWKRGPITLNKIKG